MESQIVSLQKHIRRLNAYNKYNLLIREKSSIIIQSYFRLFLVVNKHYKFIEARRRIIRLTASDCIDNVFYWFRNKTLNSNSYHTYLICINEIFEDLKRKNLYKNKITNVLMNIHLITMKMNNLFDKISTSKFRQGLSWIYNDGQINLDKKLKSFIETYFIPYQICLSESIIDANEDYRNYLLSENWTFTSIESSNVKFATLSINCSFEEEVYEITLIGHFKPYPFDLHGIEIHPINEKWNMLLSKIQNLNVPYRYAIKYINQLNLNIMIGCSIDVIFSMLENSYKRTKYLLLKPINDILEVFLGESLTEMTELLTSFILYDEKSRNISVILFESLVQNGNENMTAHQVFCGLHWTIQKIFEISYQDLSKNIKYLKSKNTSNHLSYEQRLLCTSASKVAIDKATEKIQLTTSPDVGPKACQWLDGFFKIPFNIYHYNQFFHSSNSIELKLKNTISQINSCSSIYDILKGEECDTEYQMKDIINKIKLIHKDVVLSNIGTESMICEDYDVQPKQSNFLFTNDFDISGFYSRFNEDKSLVSSTSDSSSFNFKIEKSLFDSNEKICSNLNAIKSTYNISEAVIYNNFEKIIENYDLHNNNKIVYLNNVKTILDDSCYGHDEAKKQFIRLVAQWMNGSLNGSVIGIQGPPGNGKTTLVKKGLSKCLYDSSGNPHPFGMIALGGSSNGSTIVGHNFTYVGSTWGKIVEILIEKKCMNPIIYFDEIDKISKTDHGKEITGILTHLTDTTQNDGFEDRYFSGIKLDLSKALFIMSFNDESKIDPILKDRMQIIRTNSLSTLDKVHITKKYLLPSIIKEVGFCQSSIIVKDDTTKHIVDTYTCEAGVRKLKEILFDLVREYNLRLITNNNLNIEESTIPFEISKIYIDEVLAKRQKLIFKTVHSKPEIGLINGLYATSSGVGGVTTIEVHRTYGSGFLKLILTGNQGNIMKESVQVALTVALNIIPENLKNNLVQNKDNNSFSLHIHAPASATPKDGPSAGAAITLGIISLLCDLPILNNIALTGEIDLNRKVTQIGGVYSKIQGAYKAGIDTVFIPFENTHDLNILEQEGKLDEFPRTFKIITVKSITDLIPLVFVKNDLEFFF